MKQDKKSKKVSRRDFLKNSGLSLAGLTLGAQVAASCKSPLQPSVKLHPMPDQNPFYQPSDRKVRVGVVGGGGFGLSFYWHLHPNCVVEAVSDLIPERRRKLMKKYRCQKSYESLEVLVKDDKIDAVCVFTDGNLHAWHVVEAMKHGKHAVSAVPACWGSIEEAQMLHDIVVQTGLTYMMAETAFFMDSTMYARELYRAGKFGRLYHQESLYSHPSVEHFYYLNGKRTWRYGAAPMHYPTHQVAYMTGVTGERLVDVSCQGWGDDSQPLKDNDYGNPFWGNSAMFNTDRGNICKFDYWVKGAHKGGQSAKWVGDKMSFHSKTPHGQGPKQLSFSEGYELEDGGYRNPRVALQDVEIPAYYKMNFLPPELRIKSGHSNSHTFITHDFIDSIVHNRAPLVDVYEALAYTVPGTIAHESALRGGERMKIPQFPRPS